MRRTALAALAMSIAFRAHAPANAASEICGNNADEDGDGHIDEGCNPEAYLRVREAPLPYSAVGSVSPLKGQEVWSEPPDFDIAVAYGPKLTFQRSYHSQVTQTGQARGPLGTGWMHNYMSWIDVPRASLVSS